jgi:hypothetical protein
MDVVQIITADSQRNGVDPNAVIQAVGAKTKRNAVIMHENNSVLVCTPISPIAVEVHLFTADQPLTLMRSLTVFHEHLKASHIQFIYGKADNQQILQLLKRIGVDVMPSNIPQFNWMGRV